MQVPLLVWNIRCTFRLEKLCDILFTTRLHNTIVRQANQGESGGLPATPPRWSGFRLCFIPNPAFGASRLALLACYALAGRRVAAPRWAMILSPLRAQVSARRWLAKVQFIAQRGASSKMLLIFLFSTKSLGHVCVCGLRLLCKFLLTKYAEMVGYNRCSLLERWECPGWDWASHRLKPGGK